MKQFREWLIPELRREPDESRRKAAYRHGIADPLLQVWLALSLIISGAYPYFIPSSVLGIGNLSMNAFWPVLLLLGISGMLVMMGLGTPILRPRVRKLARAYLRRHGLPICVLCGYDMTGNANGICSECGAAGSVEYEAWKAES